MQVSEPAMGGGLPVLFVDTRSGAVRRSLVVVIPLAFWLLPQRVLARHRPCCSGSRNLRATPISPLRSGWRSVGPGVDPDFCLGGVDASVPSSDHRRVGCVYRDDLLGVVGEPEAAGVGGRAA